VVVSDNGAQSGAELGMCCN